MFIYKETYLLLIAFDCNSTKNINTCQNKHDSSFNFVKIHVQFVTFSQKITSGWHYHICNQELCRIFCSGYLLSTIKAKKKLSLLKKFNESCHWKHLKMAKNWDNGVCDCTMWYTHIFVPHIISIVYEIILFLHQITLFPKLTT